MGPDFHVPRFPRFTRTCDLAQRWWARWGHSHSHPCLSIFSLSFSWVAELLGARESRLWAPSLEGQSEGPAKKGKGRETPFFLWILEIIQGDLVLPLRMDQQASPSHQPDWATHKDDWWTAPEGQEPSSTLS